jgi:cysteine-rich repeat protein
MEPSRRLRLAAELLLLSALAGGCPAPSQGCGDGVIQVSAGEACDDGNLNNGDGCDSNCSLSACGNGQVGGQEACDDGNAADGDGCDSNCTQTACGNGVQTAGEQCDDGNTTPGDTCEADCTIPADLCQGVTPTPGTDIRFLPFAAGFDQPLYLTAPPGDTARVFVVEKTGRVKIVKNGQVLATPFLDLSGAIATNSERGLLSIAFHPGFAQNGKFYADFVATGGDIHIAEFVVSANPDVADRASERTLLVIEHSQFGNHNGGLVKFGPDGFLYISVGDGGAADDPFLSGQDLQEHLGKILRIDVNAGNPFAIPADNPFANDPNARPEIWAFGVRNPWRFSFDRQTGDFYLGDVGQDQFEEIDFEPAGAPRGQNYGWSAMEGLGHCFNVGNCGQLGITLPVLEYDHGEGCSIAGGYVYRGCALPDLAGTYFYSDFCTGFIRTLEISGGAATNQRDITAQTGSFPQLSSFGEDARGELYLMRIDSGQVFKIAPAP